MKRILTNNLLEVIESNMVKVIHVELRYSSNETDTETMEPVKFIESLEHLEKSGIFSDCVNWKYEIIRVSDNENYIMVHSGCMFFTMEIKLCMCDGVGIDDVEKKFKETIFDKLSA